MAKGKRRNKAMEESKKAREARMKAHGEVSNYSKKRRYLDRNGGWGWEYSNPKPWKGAN